MSKKREICKDCASIEYTNIEAHGYNNTAGKQLVTCTDKKSPHYMKIFLSEKFACKNFEAAQ